MRRLFTSIASCLILAIANRGYAQVIPDESLPNNSRVNERLEVTGGTVAGENLFHSFQEFSINAGETVWFQNNSAIANIIGRVTGGNISQIDGLIRANGSADLFLINPNGIVFGDNASLDLGGSFIASTAQEIQFADGSQFSAIAANPSPLLTVSIPIGLQYGNNSGGISVAGGGNNLSIDLDTFTVARSDRPLGLAVDSGETLALLGNNILLPGGNLTAVDGRIVLGSVSQGQIGLSRNSLGWNFDYEEITSFARIDLSDAASVEVSGNSGGEALIRGDTISLADGSAILADTLGDGNGRRLELNATTSINLTGFAVDRFFPTRLSTDVDLDGTGNGGDLSIDTNELAIVNGAQVNSGTFGLGDGGKLQVDALEIEILGESEDGEFVSGLFAQADFGDTGDGGNLIVNADSLVVGAGGDISTTTFGTGDAGNIDIEARSIRLEGFAETFLSGSGIAVTTQGAGNGGNLRIKTDSLRVAGGADISTSTFEEGGDAGNIDIEANTVELIGSTVFGGGGLFASVETDSLGNGGNINLTANQLTIAEGAQIVALTDSIGQAGTLNINSQEIYLLGTSPEGFSSGIVATTINDIDGGQGGEIVITTDRLEIAAGAQISTTTLGSGRGGDIEIIALDTIRLEGSSDSGSSGIFATALLNDGAGGNINLQTEVLSLADTATINASNFPSSNDSSLPPGTGAAGNVNILAAEIFLDNQAIITADTLTGDRGNLNLVTDLLVLRDRSNISTNAGETATGGNITIDASNGFVVAFPQENSDITANAVFGAGGRVDITALEIFGIEPRLNLTPFSDITASSEFGITGSVTLNSQDLNPTETLNSLPDTFNPPQLTLGCSGSNSASSFINSGQGGLIPQASNSLSGDNLLGDVSLPKTRSRPKQPDGIVEAQGWRLSDRGTITLVAESVPNSSGCSEP